MYINRILFHPKKGERNSPEDKLDPENDVMTPDESAGMLGKFERFRTLPLYSISRKWKKKVDMFKQLTHGDFRALYEIIGNDIIIFHIFRKTSQDTKKEDIMIARANYKHYETNNRI